MQKNTTGVALTKLITEALRFNGEILEVGNRLTKPFGLTSARWRVMTAIRLAERPVTVAQIGRRMGLTRQGAGRIVRELRKLGFAQSTTNIDHKRAPLISISETGMRVLRLADNARFAWVDQLSQGLNEEQIEQAITALRTTRERSEQLKESALEDIHRHSETAAYDDTAADGVSAAKVKNPT